MQDNSKQDVIDYYGTRITWVPHLSGSNQPIYKQIADCIEKDIRDGSLKTGFRLPPQRIIAQYLNINHSTVTRAYKICEEKGFIKGITGKGTYVSSTAGIPEDVLSQSSGSIIDMGLTIPLYELNSSIESELKRVYPLMDYELALKYSPPEGHMKHRYIAAQWLNDNGFNLEVDNLLITSGTQNGLSVILTAMFKKADRLLVDQYTYTGLKSLAKLLGIILVPVGSDSQGIDLQDLERCCRRENPRGIYLISDYHNPTGVTLSMERRERIAELMAKYDLLLMEDGTFSFCVEEKLPSISSLIPENSFYIHGTSKALNPSLRISYLVTPKAYFKRLKVSLNHLTWMASPLTAEIISLLIRTGAYESIVAEKHDSLKERNGLFDEVMSGYEIRPSARGMFRYLSLPSHWNDHLIEHLCLEKNVQVFSSHRFSVGTESHTPGIRVSISAPQTIQDLEKGLLVLKDVIDSYEYDSRLIV